MMCDAYGESRFNKKKVRIEVGDYLLTVGTLNDLKP